jgi:hypothetical protein
VIVCGDVSLPPSGSIYCRDIEDQPDGGVPVGDPEDLPEIMYVGVEATAANGEVIYRVSADMCEWDLPFTAAMREGYETVTVEVLAWGPAGLVRSTAQPTFPATGVRELHMGLNKICIGVQCPTGRTCVAGACEPVGAGWGTSICNAPDPER